MSGDAKQLAAQVRALRVDRNKLRYQRKVLLDRIRRDLDSALAMHSSWNPSDPKNPYIAIGHALTAILEDHHV